MNLAAYLLLFVILGVGFILVHLLAGKLIRPSKPGSEKSTIYECGEPTIGSAWVQFDLRFYVVALLFVIFDVEVAFFFPWAEVFGRANAVAATRQAAPVEQWSVQQLKEYGGQVSALIPPAAGDPANERILQDYSDPEALKKRLESNPKEVQTNADNARTLAIAALGEIVVFFGVLLVGFAYLWNRGDLEWVRSLAERNQRVPFDSPVVPVPPVAPPAKPAVAVAHSH
jgi:NADH-quinone oxidoreductase subunit A